MKITLCIKREMQLSHFILKDKIFKYLQKNSYRITENNTEVISFVEDENSDRRRYRSDFHTRIGEGKFEIRTINQRAVVILTYKTSILYPTLIMLGFIFVGVYAQSLISLVGVLIFLPVLSKIIYLNENVFNNILES